MWETFSLFLGSLLDSLIGPNLIVPGEPFLLAAGYQLFYGTISGLIVVFIGGWIGDQASYWIGRKTSSRILRQLIKWRPKTRAILARTRIIMRKHGVKLMMFSRLLGPLAWFVPFISGASKVSWFRFTLCSLFGLTLGVGQFIAMGYFLASGVEQWLVENSALIFIEEHKFAFSVLSTFFYCNSSNGEDFSQ